MTGSLHRTFFPYSSITESEENEMNNPTGVSTNEIYQSGCFKAALRKEQWSALFVDHPVHSLLSTKGEQKWNISANYYKY